MAVGDEGVVLGLCNNHRLSVGPLSGFVYNMCARLAHIFFGFRCIDTCAYAATHQLGFCGVLARHKLVPLPFFRFHCASLILCRGFLVLFILLKTRRLKPNV